MNEKTLRFNPERKDQIKAAVDLRIKAIKPTVIVCSDPVSLGLFTNWDIKVSTLDKTRGGVYEYAGIPVIITIPITAIHRNVDERLVKDADGEDVTYEPYRVPKGHGFWRAIGRRLVDSSTVRSGSLAFQYSVTRSIQDCLAARLAAGL